MAILEEIIWQMINISFSISKNYGIAIILITVLIKFVFYPLTFQSSKQMAAMQRLQPVMKNLQKKYKDDPKKLQEETLNLYKREKVSHFGGCLPMIIQIPIFIGLFLALKGEKFVNAVQNAGGGGSFIWLSNLSLPDPTFIMVVLIVITTYLMQRTMPSAQQNMAMNIVMPAFIGFISLPFPSGLQLYWVASNIVTALQQIYIFRKLGVPLTFSLMPGKS